MTSQPYKLVVLDANYYWTQQLFSHCSNFTEVLLLRPHDFRTFHKLYGSYFTDSQPQLIANNVWQQRICCPPGWLFHYWWLTAQYFSHLIKKFQGQASLIFVFTYPYYYSLAKQLQAFSIYYNIDDYTDYWPGRQAQTQFIEQQAVKYADLIFCVSQYRADYFQQTYANKSQQIIHIPHGCSLEFMVNQPLTTPLNLPKELQNFKKYRGAIAGYIGTLSDRFDFHYLAQVATLLPQVTFLLGGLLPQITDGSAEWWQGVEQVKHLANVHFIGVVPHHRLGEYLQSFDVLIAIYTLCNFNLNACPTKLWDYMGTSLPIVSNNVVPEINLWKHVLLIANHPIEFAENIKLALKGVDQNASRRLEIAHSHTWADQARKLKQQLEAMKVLT